MSAPDEVGEPHSHVAALDSRQVEAEAGRVRGLEQEADVEGSAAGGERGEGGQAGHGSSKPRIRIATTQSGAEAALLAALADVPTDALDDAQRQRFDPLRTPAVVADLVGGMASEASEAWSRQVTRWLGASVPAGAVMEAVFDVPYEDVGLDVRHTFTFQVHPGEPCHDADDARACVRIDAVTRPDTEAFTAMMVATSAGGEDPAGALKRASTVMEATYVVDPATLRPWASIEVTTVEVERSEGATAVKVERTELRYQWER
jgi:hypothetical protein